MPASGLRILVIAEVSFESERRRKDELGRDIVVEVDLFGHTSLGVVGPMTNVSLSSVVIDDDEEDILLVGHGCGLGTEEEEDGGMRGRDRRLRPPWGPRI